MRLPAPLLALALAAGLAAGACAPALGAERTQVGIRIHYSRFSVTSVVVPANVPVTYTLVNDDPIDHEWLIGDAAFHERHRLGTEAVHGDLPNEVSLPAFATKTTTLTLAPGTWSFVCHFPGHEAYGMVGTVTAR